MARITGVNNRAGDLAPLKSPWGQQLFANTGELIDQPAPIGGRTHGGRGFGGTVGGFSSLSASVIAIYAEGGYGGDAPQDLQPIIQDPEPWNRA